MVSTIQLKLRGFSIVEVVQDQWNQIDTNTAGNIFTQFLTAIQNFFGNIFTQFHHFLNVLAHYLVPAVILILGVTCFICLFPYIFSIFGFLFGCISTTFRFIFSGLMKCLGYGGSAAVKMMKAPGRPAVMIARASFEACPKAYFAGLRLLSK